MAGGEGVRIGGDVVADGDRLPWLEPVDNEAAEAGVGAPKLIAAVVVALLAIGLVIGGIFWLRERSMMADGSGDLIAAPAGDYKVAPRDPGGMAVEGEGDAAYAASQGVPVDAAIDISRRPEAPVAVARGAAPGAAAQPAPVAAAAPVPAPPPAKAAELAQAVPPKPATPPAAKPPTEPVPAKGPAVQLGAFGSEASAQAAWRDLAGRFPLLSGLGHSVTLAEVGGKKLYRLRAAAGSRTQAGTVCRALTRAKEPCAVVG